MTVASRCATTRVVRSALALSDANAAWTKRSLSVVLLRVEVGTVKIDGAELSIAKKLIQRTINAGIVNWRCEKTSVKCEKKVTVHRHSVYQCPVRR